MNNRALTIFSELVLLISFTGVTYAAEPDLSGVTLTEEHRLKSDGRWEYRYTVNNDSPVKLSSLFIDISCEQASAISDNISNLDQGEGYLDSSDYPEIEALRKGDHVPARITAGYGAAAYWGITTDNEAYWNMLAEPYSVTEGIVITSKGSPTNRNYYITPEPPLPTEDVLSSHMETDDNDYALYGVTTAPSCAESTIPDESVVFDGTPPRALGLSGRNDLLTYTKPDRSSLSVLQNVNNIEMQIHYSDEIDPDTFKAEPGWARRLFNPAPGSSEVVTLPVRMGSNHFRLKVSTGNSIPENTRQDNLDIDIFNIMRKPSAPGQNKKQ